MRIPPALAVAITKANHFGHSGATTTSICNIEIPSTTKKAYQIAHIHFRFLLPIRSLDFLKSDHNFFCLSDPSKKEKNAANQIA